MITQLRRRSIRTVLALACILFCTPVGAASIRIVMLGTSLTQGYGLPPGKEIPALLQAKLKADGIDAEIINAGVSGDTSTGGLARLDWTLADHLDLSIVEFGSNDALRGISPAQTAANLSAILAKLQAKHVPTLLLGMKAPRNLGPEYAREFDEMYPTLAKRYGAVLYPFALEGVVLNAKLNQQDGMHPNAAGAKIIAERIYLYVKALARRALAKAR